MTRKTGSNLTYISYFSLGVIISLWSTIAPRIANAQATINNEAINGVAQVNLFQAIVLGFIQGMTEFIPISSTAHLKAVPVFLGWGDPGVTVSAVIQLGSIAAVLWYFWSDLSQITTGMFKAISKSNYESQDFWLAVGIAVGSIPIIMGGLAIKIFVPDFDNSPLRSMSAIAIASIFMGLLLALSEKIGTHKRDFSSLTAKDGIIIGFAQAMAIIPGCSRSGSTMTAGLFINLERATAARFSFLLGIPAITLAGIVELKDALDTGLNGSGLVPLMAGIISSAVFSYLAIAWLIKFLQRRSTWVFVWYRLGFGILILFSLSLGWIS